MTRLRSLLAAGVCALALGTTGPAGAEAAPAGAVPAGASGTPCHVPRVEDLATCHRIPVPEDRAKPDGRMIDLHVAVLPARGGGQGPARAFFLLAGGPGQAATQMGPLVDAFLDGVRETHDIVLMDQRGTGHSNPLACRLDADAEATMRLDRAEMVAGIAACRAGWDADLARYSTLDVVEDVELVRTRLGYGRLDLWGGSWGTRTALLYMRNYPGSVRSAVLDGVTAPNDVLLPGEPAHSQAALDATLAACAADAACAAAFPDLEGRFKAWFAGLDQAPPAAYADGAEGRVQSLPLDRDGVAQAIRGVLYSPNGAARLPYALDRMMAGDATALVPLALGSATVVRDTMFLGSTLSSLCREEVPRAAGVPMPAGFTGTSWIDTWRALCEGFPADPLPPGYADPVTVDVPVLLLSGALDPITPPVSAEKAAAHLPRATHLVAPAAGHITLTHGCTRRLVAQFVRQGNADGIDPACLTERGRPPFVTGPMGPNP